MIPVSSGGFAVGTLCDDVFVCAADAAEAAEITAAASEFECTEEAGGLGRCSAWTCTWRNPGGPSTIDDSEYQKVCAVTLLEPPRTILCAVYL